MSIIEAIYLYFNKSFDDVFLKNLFLKSSFKATSCF